MDEYKAAEKSFIKIREGGLCQLLRTGIQDKRREEGQSSQHMQHVGWVTIGADIDIDYQTH